MNTNQINNLSAWLEIDREKVRWNLKEIRKISLNASVLAMVKGNAYGMGLVETVGVLKSQGVQSFGVVGMKEALKLRSLDRSINIINFEPIARNDFEKGLKYNITPVILRLEDFFILEKYGESLKKQIKVFLKINTAVNRWGCSYKEALCLVKKLSKLERIKVDTLVTTLAEQSAADKKQIKILYKLKRNLKSLGVEISNISFASSQGILTLNLKDFGLIRPGIALFGIYPDKKTGQERKVLLKPVFSLKSRISQIRKIERGEKILYKNTFTASKKMVIAILPIGYQLGYNHLFQQKAQVLVKGKKCSVIGISMSATIIDISKINNPLIGQEVVLIGNQGKENISLSQLVKISGLSQYYLMTSLAKDLNRIYLN